jgi:hypothetical protein
MSGLIRFTSAAVSACRHQFTVPRPCRKKVFVGSQAMSPAAAMTYGAGVSVGEGLGAPVGAAAEGVSP